MQLHDRQRWSSALWSCLLVAFSFLASAAAQSSSDATVQSTNAATPTTFLSLTISTATITTTSLNGTQNVTRTSVFPTIYNVTVVSTPTPTSTASSSPSPTPTPEPIELDTKIDPAFGVLGAILIITGIPSAFLGHKNRWTSFFLIGFYTLSLVCLVLILKFGVDQSINPPNKTLRGLFVLACGVAGVAGGGISIFFWKATKYFIGAWGGLALGLWVQCFRDGGLIRPIGIRWVMYLACSVVGFVLCTIPKIHYHVLLLSTAFVGATAFMLGVDCYTTVGVKEFYVWNIGFPELFPKFTTNGIEFPVTQTMQIELGLLGAVALMGIAVQFQILKILQRKLKEIKAEHKRQDEAAVARAANLFSNLDQEKEEWERLHPSLSKHGRNDSADTSALNPDEKRNSTFTLIGTPRQRYQSGVSDFMAAPTPADELNRAASKQLKSTLMLPALDLGADIEHDVPPGFMAGVSAQKDSKPKLMSTAAELEDLKKKEELLADIQTIRRSIDILKSETPDPSSSSTSRRPSFSSPFTLGDFGSFAPGPSHLRPPRQPDPRGRVQSMALSSLSPSSEQGLSIGRPTSVPLNDDWDKYVHDRKLLQPPSGVTAPIPTTPISPVKLAVPPAVAEALMQRRRRESSLSYGHLGGASGEGASTPTPQGSSGAKDSTSEDVHVPRPQHQKTRSHDTSIPVTILPPRKPQPVASPTPQRPEMPRVKTFEELAERHREKIKEMQAPLTQAEQELAAVDAARSRWERAKALEKQAVTKRQAEQVAAATKEAKKKRKSGDGAEVTGKGANEPRAGHTRSLSADVLAAIPGSGSSSKRLSTMKVEDWQKHQLQDVELGAKPESARDASASKRRSGVPFPDSATAKDRHQMSTQPRGPPN